MQVDRSDGLPLDITWVSDFRSRYIIRLFVSIQEVAPFSRWRSLQLSVSGRNSHVESLLASVIEFPNLESLIISRGASLRLAERFCHASMPKLQTLDLRACNDARWENLLIVALNRGTLSLPDSIITLRVGSRKMHSFPNIRDYGLNACTFKSNVPTDLRSMTRLIIDGGLYVHEECDVLLPALQYLRLMNMTIYSRSKIEAPLLQTLHLSAILNQGDPLYTRYANYYAIRPAVNTPGYRLSPKNLIIGEPYLQIGEIIELLEKSRELTQATVCFKDQKSAQEVVEALFAPNAEDALPNERLCSQLTELRLDCWWDADAPFSAEWLSGLEVRKEDSPRTRVSIKAHQKGEETYQLLAEW
jgi:hypothetical protein